MKGFFLKINFILFFINPVWGFNHPVYQQEILFFKGTFNSALSVSAQSKKPLLLVFSTSWCGYCKKMKQSTFNDPRVIEMINKSFIPMEIDAEKGEGITLAKKYGVTSYPTIVIVDKNGKALLTSEGYHEPLDLINTLQSVIN
jgi:thioredoxin-related protein